MDRIWYFDRSTGMAMLIPADTPFEPCKNVADLRRIASEYRRRKTREVKPK